MVICTLCGTPGDDTLNGYYFQAPICFSCTVSAAYLTFCRWHNGVHVSPNALDALIRFILARSAA